MEVELRDGDQVLAKGYAEGSSIGGNNRASRVYRSCWTTSATLKLWDVTTPNLYSVHVRLVKGDANRSI